MDSALDAVRDDALLEQASSAIHDADLHRRTGRVVDLIGLIVEATGLEAEVGEVCTIETGRSRSEVPAEGVGFRAGRTLLMALGDATSFVWLAFVTVPRSRLKFYFSDGLLGRPMHGLGRPL